MNKLRPRAYLKSLLIDSTFLIILLMVFVICYGYKGDYLFIFRATNIFIMIFMPLMLWQQCRFLCIVEKYRLSFKLSIVMGLFSGIVFTFAVKVGQALNYLLWASNKTTGTLIHIFVDFWQIYLWMGLLGIVCMSIEPFFRIVLHKDLFNNPRQSPFWMKYLPSALFSRFILRKDLSKRSNANLDGKNK